MRFTAIGTILSYLVIRKYKSSAACQRLQVHNYKYTNTYIHTQILIDKYKYTNTNTQNREPVVGNREI